jgi:hypothetical protein
MSSCPVGEFIDHRHVKVAGITLLAVGAAAREHQRGRSAAHARLRLPQHLVVADAAAMQMVCTMIAGNW